MSSEMVKHGHQETFKAVQGNMSVFHPFCNNMFSEDADEDPCKVSKTEHCVRCSHCDNYWQNNKKPYCLSCQKLSFNKRPMVIRARADFTKKGIKWRCMKQVNRPALPSSCWKMAKCSTTDSACRRFYSKRRLYEREPKVNNVPLLPAMLNEMETIGVSIV